MLDNLTKQKMSRLNYFFFNDGFWIFLSHLCRQLPQVRPCSQLVSCHWHTLSPHSRRNLKMSHHFWLMFLKIYDLLTDRERTLFNFVFWFLEIAISWLVWFSAIPIVCCWYNGTEKKIKKQAQVACKSCIATACNNCIATTLALATNLSHFNCLTDWCVAVPHVGQGLIVSYLPGV